MPKVLSYRDWESIKQEYCSGSATSAELAQKYRVSQKTLRSRACREQWPTPARFKETMAKAVQIAQDVVMQGFRGAEEPGSAEDLALRGLLPLVGETDEVLSTVVGQQVATPATPASNGLDANEYQRAIAEFATRKILAGWNKMKPPSNWRELNTADTIARRALGLDSKGGASAVAMVRVTGAQAGVVDVAVAVQADGEGGEDDE